MTDILVLILFVLSGAASGWLGVDLLPIDILKQVSNVEGFRIVVAIIGFFYWISRRFLCFYSLERHSLIKYAQCLRYLLISRAVGLILGLLVANLLLAPILLIPFPREVFFAKPSCHS